jgi:pimeloyl-ACP methyl ester carboxylesterase
MAGHTSPQTPDRQPEMLSLDDRFGKRRLAVLRSASTDAAKPGVFWLPGFNSDMTSSKATALADWAKREGRALTRFDYSGHGASEGKFTDGTIGQWLADARAVFEQMTAGSQIVAGSSMGGYLALLLAGTAAKRLAGLVLIAPAWNMTERLMWDEMPEPTRNTLMRDDVWLRPSAYGDPYPITRQLIEEGRSHLIDIHHLPLPCALRVLHGAKDADVPFDGSVALVQAQIDNDAKLIAVPDGDHRLARERDIGLLINLIEGLEEE